MKITREQINVNPCNHIIKLDGITIAKLVKDESGTVCLQLLDKNRWQAAKRGSEFVEIPVTELVQALCEYDQVDCLIEIRNKT